MNKSRTIFVAAVSMMSLCSFGALAEYPLARIHNRTPFPVSGTIHYASMFCRNDNFNMPAGVVQKDGSLKEPAPWVAKSRGVCLVTSITAAVQGGGKGVTSYSSSGTSYSNFIISPTQSDFRVWSDHELNAEMGREQGKSPGFYIVNRTKWPISVSLEQVGCLYYATIKPGEAFNRNTGAVWFTIKAQVQADGKEQRTDWDCVKPVAAVVGAVVVAAATGGAGAFAMAGATAGSVAVAAAGAAALPLAKFGVAEVGALMAKNSDGQLKGQYAGPEWPFRCPQKPVYFITGGPSLDLKNGQIVLGEGTPLTLIKQNDCGNSMMASNPSVPGAPSVVQLNMTPVGNTAAAAAGAPLARPAPAAPAAGGGYTLLFDGKVVSGPDAASFTLAQAQENCTWNRATKPSIKIECRYNGAPMAVAAAAPAAAGGGYVLMFDGKVVSGPDAAGYSLQQAKDNCTWNKQGKPSIKIECRFNGAPI